MRPTRGSVGKPEWRVNRMPHFDLNPFMLYQLTQNPYEPVATKKKINVKGKGKNQMTSGYYSQYRNLLGEGNNNYAYASCPSRHYPKLRAVLQLSESTEETGGFECSVGFHRQLLLWCYGQMQTRTSLEGAGMGVTPDDPVAHNMQKITCRAGSLILFTAELPHTMFPNDSNQFRYAQYLRMTPLSTLSLTEEMLVERRALIQDHLPSDLEITDIGREVFLL